MKTKVLITAFLLICFAPSFSQTIPTNIPANGLVGWWPFNGNANDVSGNGNHGTVSGAQLTTDRNGTFNTCYSFNPSWSSHISVPFSSSLNSIQNGITISSWIYMDGGTGAGTPPRILELRGAYGGGGNAGFVLLANDNASTRTLYLRWYNNNGGSNLVFNSTTSLASLSWHHIVFTADGTTGIAKYYFDGILIQSVSGANITSCNYNNNALYFGAETGLLGMWGGKLDDIGIWNRALTQTEITTLYNECTLEIASHPLNKTVNITENAQFIVGTLDTNINYQWQTDLGLGFQNISNAGQYSGVNTDSLKISNTSMSNNNQQFRCIISKTGCASDTSDVVTLTVINNVGIQGSAVEAYIKIYPNPAHDKITLEVDKSLLGINFSIINSLGQETLNGKIISEKIVLNINSLPKGIYSLMIRGQQVKSFKVVKE